MSSLLPSWTSALDQRWWLIRLPKPDRVRVAGAALRSIAIRGFSVRTPLQTADALVLNVVVLGPTVLAFRTPLRRKQYLIYLRPWLCQRLRRSERRCGHHPEQQEEAVPKCQRPRRSGPRCSRPGGFFSRHTRVPTASAFRPPLQQRQPYLRLALPMCQRPRRSNPRCSLTDCAPAGWSGSANGLGVPNPAAAPRLERACFRSRIAAGYANRPPRPVARARHASCCEISCETQEVALPRTSRAPRECSGFAQKTSTRPQRPR